MTLQPCPDCGTIMHDCGHEAEMHYDWLFCCPHCGQEWTPEDIQEAYDLMGLTEDEGDSDVLGR